MNSPLNSAHQQGRKADSFIKCGKIDDAIACHNRAAEHILEAMRHTSCQTALQSIQLQHAHHLKMTTQLMDRRRIADMLKIRQNKSQTSYKSQSSQTDLQGPVAMVNNTTSDTVGTSINMSVDQTDHRSFQQYLNYSPKSQGSDSDTIIDSVSDSVYRTLTENDSLMGLLIRRRQNLEGHDLNSHHSGVPIERVFYKNTSPTQNPTETDLRDELRSHNEELRKHVRHLLREVEELKKDKKGLQDKIERYERKDDFESQTIFHDMGKGGLELLPDLPPLEMPTFNMDLLLGESSEDSEVMPTSPRNSASP